MSELIAALQDQTRVCGCVATHRPQPLELNRHHILPKELGGATVDENLVWVCPSTHSSVHVLLREQIAAGRVMTRGEMDAAHTRPVPRYAAGLAQEGMRRYLAHHQTEAP